MSETPKKNLGADAAAVVSAGSIDSDAATARHTPGPWAVFDSEIVSHHTDQHIADAPLEDGMNPTEWQANAHLIAAAPELLETLKALVDAYEDPMLDDPHSLVLAAKEAIAKAEGHRE